MTSNIRANRHRTMAFTRATHHRASRTDLEIDSGFSDASSENLSTVDVTDSEDAATMVRSVSEVTGPQVTVMRGSYSGLSPMIIMNNFFLKQQSLMASAEKKLGLHSPVEVRPPSQVVPIQPVVSNGSSSSTSPKTCSENIRQSKSYTPIFKTYPKIAPHPSDVPTRRDTSFRVRLSSASTQDQRKRRPRRGHRLHSSPSPQPAQTTVKPFSYPEAENNRSHVPESQEQLSDRSLSLLAGTSALPLFTNELTTVIDSRTMHAEKYQDSSLIDGNKQKRFSNTYNILNNYGMLGITMRIKQLIRENRRTQGQLLQLQEQTAMLLKALSSGNPQLWSKLQVSLQHTDKDKMWGKVRESCGDISMDMTSGT